MIELLIVVIILGFSIAVTAVVISFIVGVSQSRREIKDLRNRIDLLERNSLGRDRRASSDPDPRATEPPRE